MIRYSTGAGMKDGTLSSPPGFPLPPLPAKVVSGDAAKATAVATISADWLFHAVFRDLENFVSVLAVGFDLVISV